MTLFQQLQDDILNDELLLSSVLRRAKVFAAKLPSINLRAWVESELNGYPDKSKIPGYRRRSAVNYGSFIHQITQEVSESAIPLERIPSGARKYVDELALGNSVRSLEEILESGPGPYRLPWPGSLLERLADTLYADYRCRQAWKVIHRSLIESILDSIRTKLLNLLLALEKTDPDIVDSDQALAEVPAQRLELILQKVIYEHDSARDKGNALTRDRRLSASAVGHKQLETFFKVAMSQSERHGTRFAVVLLGTESVAKTDDERAPQVLLEIAAWLEHQLRTGDVIGRWNDQYVILATHTGFYEAQRIAERLRQVVYKHPFVAEHGVDIGTGVATYQADDDLGAMIARAQANIDEPDNDHEDDAKQTTRLSSPT